MPPDYTDLVSTAGAGVLWALLVFAAPGDLLGSTVARRPRAAVLPALLLAASTLVHSAGVISASQNTTETLSATFLLLGLLSLAFLRWGRLLPTATGLAILPIVFTNAVLLLSYHVFSWFDYWLGDLGMLVNYVVGATLVALLTAGAVRFLYHQPSASPEASSDLSAQ
ncbi:phosphoglycerol transferase MdoB-like AlkP superfamily enzyme [Kitasatospora sp. MAP12-44]|nr:hypothetical protein [Kitasatospora sp. MAP12-44]MDH6113376.1 phosphoglycerol transferase MdoB-like AlkP superfamily enzyme [Kitasatospora sp. MAP12-44]